MTSLVVKLDSYANAPLSGDEPGIGTWNSGFFGSGKSLLVKTIGALLEGGVLGGQSVDDIFLDRVSPTTPLRGELRRLLAECDPQSRLAWGRWPGAPTNHALKANLY
jgi:hypothetical protein